MSEKRLVLEAARSAPFAGTGTTGTALGHGRRFIGIDVVPRFIRMAHERMKLVAGSKV